MKHIVWLFSVFKNILSVVPGFTAMAVFISIISQVSQVVAFILPLKVIILFGSTRIPYYFPEFMLGVERDVLIVVLSFLSVALYLVHILLERLVIFFVREGSDFLLSKSSKFVLLERQDELAHSFYNNSLVALSGLMFAVMLSFFLLILKPWLAFCIVLYFFLAIGVYYFIIFFINYKVTFPELAKIYANGFSATGFMLVFAFLVTELMRNDGAGLLLSILVLLLSRQFFSKLSAALKAMGKLYSDRERVYALFFQNPPLLNEKREVDFWQMMHPQVCKEWVGEALFMLGIEYSDFECGYLDSGVRRQIILSVKVFSENKKNRYYFFKIYESRRALQADQEAVLLGCDLGEFVPRLVLRCQFSGLQALILQHDNSELVLAPERKFKESQRWLFGKLWSWPIPEALESSYLRSRATLSDRLNYSFWSRCRTVSEWLGEDVKSVVEWFAENPEKLNSVLRRIPLAVYSGRIPSRQIFRTLDGFFISGFEGWHLEPVGYGWPLKFGEASCQKVFAQACADRGFNLKGVSFRDVWVVALISEVERLCVNGAFSEAFDLLADVRKFLLKF